MPNPFEAKHRKIRLRVISPSDNDMVYFTPQEITRAEYRLSINSDTEKILPGTAAAGTLQFTVRMNNGYMPLRTGASLRAVLNATDMSTGDTADWCLGRFTVQRITYRGSTAELLCGDSIALMEAQDFQCSSGSIYSGDTMPFNAAWDELSRYVSISESAATKYAEYGASYLLFSSFDYEIPKLYGYNRREVLGYFAGRYGCYAIDSCHLTGSLDHDNTSADDRIVLCRLANAEWQSMPQGMIFSDGLMLESGQNIEFVPTVYVESQIKGGEASRSQTPEDAPSKTTDIRYLENPDEIKSGRYFANEMEGVEVGPYWLIRKDTDYRYRVYFFSEQPQIYAEETAGAISRSVRVYMSIIPQGHADTSGTSTSDIFMWRYAENPIYLTVSDSAYIFGENLYGENTFSFDDVGIVAANFNLSSVDNSWFFAQNGAEVGSLRTGYSSGGNGLTYGVGDYTNPLIFDDEQADDAQMWMYPIAYRPGTVRWRGDPRCTGGTKIYVGDIPFVVCENALTIDAGGMCSDISCHGLGAQNRSKGIPDQLARVSGMKKKYELVQSLKPAEPAEPEVTETV